MDVSVLAFFSLLIRICASGLAGYGLNQTWNIDDTPWPDMIGIQFQLDQDTSGTPLHEWVDNVNLTMW
ncbi:MAG: hypothetical protein ACLGP3_00440 [Acidobacteriota bacterium]